MTSTLIHVRCNSAGDWVVHPEGFAEPISEHAIVTAAERAAIAYAATLDDTCVVVHDRYSRVRFVPVPRETAARVS